MSVSPPVRPPRRRAPRNSLNPDRILDAAVTLLDQDGIEAFTMRALADRLGVGTMAVYSYFKGKDELNAAVAQRLLASVELPPAGSADPACELREVCRGVFRLITEHPSALQLLTLGPVRGGEAIAVIERMLHLLCRSGLPPAAAARAHVALMQYTVGSALWNIRRARVLRAEGLRDEVCHGESLPAQQYLALVALAPDLTCEEGDGDTQYELGLDALMRGLLPDRLPCPPSSAAEADSAR